MNNFQRLAASCAFLAFSVVAPVHAAGGIEDSYFKIGGDPQMFFGRELRPGTPVPPAKGPYSFKHIRNGDGSIDVDSALRWNDNYNYWQAIFSVSSNEVGFSTERGWPIRTWKLTGGTPVPYAPDDLAAGLKNCNVNLAMGGTKQGTGYVSSSTLKVKLQDKDGAIAENTFNISWHLPVEWDKTPYKTPAAFWEDSGEVVEITKPKATPSGSIEGVWKWNNFYVGVIKDAGLTSFTSATAIIIAEGTPGVVQLLFFQVADLALDKLVEDDRTPLDASFEWCWTTEWNDVPNAGANWEGGRPKNADGTWDNSKETKDLYRLTSPRLVCEYQDKWYRGDDYDQHGYLSEERKIARKWTGRAHVVGTFELSIKPTPSPAPTS